MRIFPEGLINTEGIGSIVKVNPDNGNHQIGCYVEMFSGRFSFGCYSVGFLLNNLD